MRYHIGTSRRDDALMVRVYDSAPVLDPNAVPAWQELARDTDYLYRRMTTFDAVRVQVTDGPAPYRDAGHMAQCVRRDWTLTVSSADSVHPVWSVEQNVRFRAVHDYYGHIVNSDPRYPVGFDLDGEWYAYQRQAGWLTSTSALWALMVEVYGQAAMFYANGEFPVQKVFVG